MGLKSQRDVRSEQVQAILNEWRQTNRHLYATVFHKHGMQTCAGEVTAIDDEGAVIAASHLDLHIPYASAGQCAVVTLDQRTKSVTLTWRDGMSAFIVTRNGTT